jgi:hypothetical protein
METAGEVLRKEEAAGVCGGRGQLWDLNSFFLDNGRLKVGERFPFLFATSKARQTAPRNGEELTGPTDRP